MAQHDQTPELDLVAYQIRVRGTLDEHWSEWFGGMAVRLDGSGTASPVTTLTGVLDQSALHGILARIRDLNLALLSVTRLEGKPNAQKGEQNGKTAENGMA